MSHQKLSFNSTNATFVALGVCDLIWTVRDALSGFHADPTSTVLRQALEALAGHVTPAMTPGLYLSATRHDGASLAYDMTWSSACACVRYSGPARDLG
jgi:hypothetical protein